MGFNYHLHHYHYHNCNGLNVCVPPKFISWNPNLQCDGIRWWRLRSWGWSLQEWDVCMLSCFSHVQLFATLWTVACQAPLSMGSPGRNKVVGCHALLQGTLPHEWGKYPCKRDPQRASSFAPSALRRNKESTVCNQKRLLTIAWPRWLLILRLPASKTAKNKFLFF